MNHFVSLSSMWLNVHLHRNSLEMKIERVKNLNQVCDRVIHAWLFLPFVCLLIFILLALVSSMFYLPLKDTILKLMNSKIRFLIDNLATVKKKSEIESYFNFKGCVWPFVTPWTVTHQPPLPMGFSRQEFWGGLPFPSPGDLPNPGNEHRSLALQADSLPFEPLGKPSNSKRGLKNQSQRLAKGCHRWLPSVVHARLSPHPDLELCFHFGHLVSWDPVVKAHMDTPVSFPLGLDSNQRDAATASPGNNITIRHYLQVPTHLFNYLFLPRMML